MNRTIKKVAVLGSGIMGSRIACHFANIGVQVLLLDIVPRELNAKEKKAGLTLESPQVRNRLVTEAFTTAVKSNPAPLYDKAFADRITLGNFEDDMPKIKDYDWIIEVVVERLDIKKIVFDQVEKYRTPGTLISSNTSGIPIHMMLEGRSEDFRKHFCGTHFFNPPRYLKLLEVIPTPETDPEIIDFMMHYGDLFLGKTTVLAKDTPAFIANRVGIWAIMKVIETMGKLGLNVDQIDKLTGPVIGRPKSATFRTSDVVGLDTLINVANGLYAGLPNDEGRELFKLPEVVTKLQENNWLGDKTKQGFYKKTKNAEGKREILTLNLETMEYQPKQKAKFATLEQTKPIENLRERMPVLLKGKDEAGEFYRHSFYGLFQYVSNRIPEIADELYKIDDGLKTGFGWELGAFEAWDSVNVAKTVEKMEELGYAPNPWVKEMLAAGATTFYRVENGQNQYWDIPAKAYKTIPGTENFIMMDSVKADTSKVLWSKAEASILDLGDGVLNVEFHGKMNTLGSDPLNAINVAIDMAEDKGYNGVVIGNQGSAFSAGANLGIVFMYAVEQEYDELNMMIAQFQNTMMRVRYSGVPVVVAPHGMTLGGGCEVSMHGDLMQASAETYIGLVELGVGLIPAGGGTKEMTLRVSEGLETGDVGLNNLQNAFMNIATAKVATSAEEARAMHILRPQDRITMNQNRQIADAKQAVLELAEAGYTQPAPKKVQVMGRNALALFYAGISGMRMGNYISDHDRKIAQKLAFVMAGGDLSEPTLVSEQYLLDLEREAFLSLTGEKKTLERIQSVVRGGKPLRN